MTQRFQVTPEKPQPSEYAWSITDLHKKEVIAHGMRKDEAEKICTLLNRKD